MGNLIAEPAPGPFQRALVGADVWPRRLRSSAPRRGLLSRPGPRLAPDPALIAIEAEPETMGYKLLSQRYKIYRRSSEVSASRRPRWLGKAAGTVICSGIESPMLKLIRIAFSHYSELVLAGTFATMIARGVLELTVPESAPGASLSLTLLAHALQVALILAATALALRAWREKTVRERALAPLVEKVVRPALM
jgi:hypothetical protein